MRLRALYVDNYSGKKTRGFTFLEVTLLIALILIIGVTSTWFTVQFLFQQQTVIAAQLVRASLSQASLYAQSGRAYSDWGVMVNGESIVVFAGASYEERDVAFDQSILLPSDVAISGLESVVFTRLTGETNQATITISGNNQEIRYTLSRFGALTKL